MALVGVLALAGCPKPPPPLVVKGPAPLCAVETPLGAEKPPKDRTYPPGYWLALLLKGYRAGGDLDRPTHDCRGVKADIEVDGCASEPQADVIPGGPLSPQDVVVV